MRLLKVRNQKVVSELAKITYKANKKRNFLTIVAIAFQNEKAGS